MEHCPRRLRRVRRALQAAKQAPVAADGQQEVGDDLRAGEGEGLGVDDGRGFGVDLLAGA